jgi:pimeloyl-ACP methyl ester carboxylesterase
MTPHRLKRINWIIGLAVMAVLGYQAAIHIGPITHPPPQMSTVRAIDGTTGALVFVHGWRGSDQSWGDMVRLAIDDPRLATMSIYSVAYPTHLTARSLNISEYAAWLSRELRLTGKRTVVVAHSLGGVITRKAMLLDQLANRAPSIVGVVTIASPHGGAGAASLASALGISPVLLADVSLGSSWLRSLQQEWSAYRSPGSLGIPFQCLGSPADEVVSLASAYALCDPDSPPPFPQWSHTAMVVPGQRTDPRYAVPIGAVIEMLRRR